MSQLTILSKSIVTRSDPLDGTPTSSRGFQSFAGLARGEFGSGALQF